jgi:hypothetical protein
MQAARVALDTARGEQAKAEAEHKQAGADQFKAEMEVAVGTSGAQEQVDEARARSLAAAQAAERFGRAVQAAGEITKVREAQLTALYDDPEAFPSFCREAEAATAGAVRDLQELRHQLATASQSWAKASALWRPLNPAIRRRLEERNAAEGRYPNTAGEAAVRPFPFSLPSDLATLAPRPPGIERLRTDDVTPIVDTGSAAE